MSSLARQLLGATGALTTVTGSVFGSGSLAIPAGVVLVTLTGQGGTGSDNSYYNPGQPYIAPSGYNAAVAAYYTYYVSIPARIISVGGGSSPGGSDPGAPTTGTDPFFSTSWSQWNGSSWDLWATGYDGIYHAGTPAFYDYPGQPYIAPTSGGGIYSGSNTTATLNGVTDTWAGGYGGVATLSIQTLASTGAGQTLTYSIASGGSLNYSYTY